MKYIFIVMVCLLGGTSSYGLEKVKLQLKWLHQFQFAGYYAAAEKGYYADVGLEVEFVEAQPGKSPVQAVIDGEAEYGVATSDIARLRAEGHAVVALAVIFQHSPLALISSEEAGVTTIHDLVGKKVMIQDGSADLISMLKDQQVPTNQIEFVPHELSHQALVENKVQAISGYITNEPISLIDDGIHPIIFNPQSVGIDFYGDALFTMESHIADNPEQVELFREASLQGWDYALEHPEEIIDLILKKYSTRKSKAELTYEAEKSYELIRPDMVALGHMNPKRWAHIAKILKEEGMLSEPVNIDDMLYKQTAPFPLAPFLQVLGISLACIALLSICTYHQFKLKRELELEIERRKHGDQTLVHREEEYRSLYTDAPLAFIVWDTELRIREWNHEAEKLFGWTAEEVIGTTANDFLIPESSSDKINEGKAALQKNATHSQINENCTKDGRIIWCKWNNVSRRDAHGEVIEFHSIAADVTDEINERMRLQKEFTKILDANKSKDLLLAHTSHEIRNPLNAIMGFTQIIHSEAKDEETKEMAKIILDGTESMLEILNDLLDSAKIESGQMEIKWCEVDPAACVNKAVKLYGQSIANKGLELSVTIDKNLPMITSDQRFLQQILNNLISNARKYTPAGTIEISVEKDGSDHIQFKVKDTGVGIDADSLESVFQPYTQLPQEKNPATPGTGLGLAVARKMAEQLGGTLSAESSEGGGSLFTLRLPIERLSKKPAIEALR